MVKKSKTNETTRSILDFLTNEGHFVWRANVLPIPLPGGGYRSGGKSGTPDILGVCGNLDARRGVFLGIEVKTGKDRLRPEQEGFHFTARKLGAIILVVKDYEDFKEQWNKIFLNC